MRHELSFATAAAGAEEVEVAVAVVVGVEDSICFLGCSVVVRASSPPKRSRVYFSARIPQSGT